MNSTSQACLRLLTEYANSSDVDISQKRLALQAARAAEVVARLARPGALVLGDPVGTGKTPIALAATKVLLDRGATYAALVAPNQRVARQWFERGSRIGLKVVAAQDGVLWRKNQLVVATLAGLSRMPSPDPAASILIIDEAHRGLQNDGTAAARNVRPVALGTRLLFVTATPYQLQASGLVTMLSLADPRLKTSLAVVNDYSTALNALLGAHHDDPSNVERLTELNEKARGLRTVAAPALRRHFLSDYPRDEMGVPMSPRLKAAAVNVPPAWRAAYQVARIVPELIDVGKGDMVQRELASSSEAFWQSKAGTEFDRACRKGPRRELHELLRSRLGDGNGHPKVAATAAWAAAKHRRGRNVIVFCVFNATQTALASAITELLGDSNVVAPGDSVPARARQRFQSRQGPPVVIVARDNLSESIDLDGGGPCVVHHDLVWSPMRLEQRYGRVVRISSGFEPVAAADVYIPVLPVEVDRRMFETLQLRQHKIDMLVSDDALEALPDTFADQGRRRR